MQDLTRGAAGILGKKGVHIAIFRIPGPEDHARGFAHPGLVDIGDKDTTFILHSSGTTALPKPPAAGSLTSATSHVSCGAVFAIYTPSSPRTIPTPANFLSAWEADKCNFVFCALVFIEAWGRDPANLPATDVC
ncbi:hypothetical protein OH76DRAFT_1484656 [Lentinus brumalis]|uniref:Uncharacterized protein n=1 Tax=Lentinus brumalis TaxID=2498619 RepID=A0A371D4T7_9APHY|nr:hypothetical protein OH76DRAFT_1484656 [Polyporus brumalis]